VWAVRRDVAKRISILRGNDTQGGVEVRQGLKDGDVLIVTLRANLSDGQNVRTAVH
jgi:hypothetical protein